MLDRMADVGAWVQAKREGLGLTQKAFAELLGMPETGERTVRGWELGEHLPTPAKRAQIESLPDTAPLRSPYADDPDSAEFSFIDLFAGIGGIRYPFQKNGGHCVFTSEWDKFAKKTYAANPTVKSPTATLQKSLRVTFRTMTFFWRASPAKHSRRLD